MMRLPTLIQGFDISGRLVKVGPMGRGNVNDTFLAVFRNTFAEEQVILQRVNRRVFPQPDAIMRNLRRLTAHAHAKLEAAADASDRVWQLSRIVPTRGGKDFLVDDEGELWRAMTRIPSATAYERVQHAGHACECGAVLGHFHWLVSDLDPRAMADPLPGFHITPFYLAKYDATLREAPQAGERLRASAEARRLARFIEERRGFAQTLQRALAAGELDLRLMHGDPKVNNVMIDDFTGKGTAMIDLDTVGPGLIHYDFGDALRSLCNPAGEEEPDLGNVAFDLGLCEAFCNGYMAQAGAFLTATDRRYLYDAVRLIAFELGLRFFQDYLAGNVYFKTREPEQNLGRARVQFRLCESVEAQERPMRSLLARL